MADTDKNATDGVEDAETAETTRPSGATVLTVLGALLGALLLFLLLSVGYVAAFTPNCESCHMVGEFEQGTLGAAHASVECATCHVPVDLASRVSFASQQVFSMRLGILPPAGRKGAFVPDDVCLGCHEMVVLEVTYSKGYAVKHVSCAEGRACVDCHSATAHGSAAVWPRTPQMSDCMECHSDGDGTAECDTCHDERTESERLGTGPWSVTHGPDWASTHGMGEPETCGACHPQDFCSGCHGVDIPHDEDFKRRHAEQATAADARCEECHSQAFCDDCHGLEMPHPDAFTPEHADIVEADGQQRVRHMSHAEGL